MIRVLHGEEESEHAFVSVRYRDTWFWIDDRDFESKRTFAFAMLIWNLTQVEGGAAGDRYEAGFAGFKGDTEEAEA